MGLSSFSCHVSHVVRGFFSIIYNPDPHKRPVTQAGDSFYSLNLYEEVLD